MLVKSSLVCILVCSPSQVFVDQLTCTDIEFIGDSMFPSIDKEIISKMVAFNNTVGFSFSAAAL